ncbi:MAG: hypothetical protein Q9169_002514 [Polycauliona sp. 2 TL-2023]
MIGKGDWKSLLKAALDGPDPKPNLIVRPCVLSYKLRAIVAIVVDVLHHLDQRNEKVV